jgi:hypothetical protein
MEVEKEADILNLLKNTMIEHLVLIVAENSTKQLLKDTFLTVETSLRRLV